MYKTSGFLVTVLLFFAAPLIAKLIPQDRPDPVYHVGGSVKAPIVIVQIKPEYTDEARAAKITGVVALECVVKKDGTVSVTRTVAGLGHGLDENARAALEQFRFRPGTKDGEPVNVLFVAKINFHLPPK